MSVSAEQSELQKAIVARVVEIQDVVRRSLASLKPVQQEFLVDEPLPTTPEGAVALGQAIAPVAQQYRTLLLPRGVDVAKVNHLAKLTADLAKLVAATPASAPASEPESTEAASDKAAKPAAKGKKKAKK